MRPMRHKAPSIVQLCQGQVRHKRLRPVRNAFSYGVFYLRVPVHAPDAGLPALRWFSRNRFNLLAFHDADHGDGTQPLQAWISALLARHGVQDADGEIWLQTMPRVLGYLFNPVSFWFCHRADGVLRAVLCDVRNTFGERHLYLLENGGGIANGALLEAAKSFHVSPFLPLRAATASASCAPRAPARASATWPASITWTAASSRCPPASAVRRSRSAMPPCCAPAPPIRCLRSA